MAGRKPYCAAERTCAGPICTNADIAREIVALRTEAGLSQRALADLVGTTASVICRLENARYGGHSLAMLQRIAAAVGRRVEVRFVPAAAALP
jgi:transcriptional regulator with XRE-family HTH domain